MRARITFVHSADDRFDPEQFRLDNDTLHLSSVTAVREDQLTISLYELPQEVATGLLKRVSCTRIDLDSYGES